MKFASKPLFSIGVRALTKLRPVAPGELIAERGFARGRDLVALLETLREQR
jgi:hypothetical protein